MRLDDALDRSATASSGAGLLNAEVRYQVKYPNVLRRCLGTVLDWVFILPMLLAIAKIGVTREYEDWVPALVGVLAGCGRR